MVRFELYFAGNFDYAMRHAPPMSVVLWPHADDRSDAGYRVLAGMLVRMHSQPEVLKAPIAFFAETFDTCLSAMETVLRGQQFAQVEGDFLYSSSKGESAEGNRPWFATLQGNVQSYRTLVRALGSQAAKEALRAAHDVNAYDIGTSHHGALRQVVSSRIFQRAVLRSNERYFAYRRGQDVLDGNEAEALKRFGAHAVVHFRLTGFSAPHEIELDFRQTGLFDHRINVLIGENGVGKSQTLVSIVTGLSRLTVGPTFVTRDAFSRVIAFSAAPSKSALPGKLRSQRQLLYRHFALAPSWSPSASGAQLTTSLVDMARDDTRIGNASRLQLFADAIRDWLPLSRIGLPVRIGADVSGWYYTTSPNWRDQPSQAYLPMDLLLNINENTERYLADLDLTQAPKYFAPTGEPEDPADRIHGAAVHRFRHWREGEPPQRRHEQPLSSGQELFVRFALNLCAFIEAGTLVLLDEPENHLHPTFITQLMSLLREILQATGSFAVVATHSPFVVREVTASDVSIMSRDEEGRPVVRTPRLQTLGASVAAVSGYVFGDKTVPTLARLTEEAFLRARGRNMDPNDEGALQELSYELSSEAVGYIRSRLLKDAQRQGGSS